MKRSVLAVASFVILITPAFAADVPAPVYKAAPMFNWTGFYAGVHGGYAFGSDQIFDGIGADNFRIRTDGGFGGVQFGYNSQFSPHWLIGSEFDFSWGGLKGNALNTGTTGEEKIDFLGTARTRLGYVQDRTMYYVTGGVAWTHALFQTIGGGSPVTGVNRYDIGWTVGGGVEYALDNFWSLKFEYLYASFDRTHAVSNNGAVSYNFDPNLSAVKVGVNYKFGSVAQSNYVPVKAVASRSNWEGGYFGAQTGYAWSNYHSSDTLDGTNWRFNADGGFAGIQSGYNWIYASSMLLGIETDAAWGDINGNGTSLGRGFRAKIDDMGTLRGRWGNIQGNNLFYVTGGGAYAQEKSAILGNVTTVSTKQDHFGWTIGTGIESKFAPEWSWKLEYLYADFSQTKAHDLGGHDTYGFSTNTVKVGLNYSGPFIEKLFTGSLQQ